MPEAVAPLLVPALSVLISLIALLVSCLNLWMNAKNREQDNLKWYAAFFKSRELNVIGDLFAAVCEVNRDITRFNTNHPENDETIVSAHKVLSDKLYQAYTIAKPYLSNELAESGLAFVLSFRTQNNTLTMLTRLQAERTEAAFTEPGSARHIDAQRRAQDLIGELRWFEIQQQGIAFEASLSSQTRPSALDAIQQFEEIGVRKPRRRWPLSGWPWLRKDVKALPES